MFFTPPPLWGVGGAKGRRALRPQKAAVSLDTGRSGRAAMVNFSDRKAFEHWLAGIESAERRREVAVAFAARSALRATPWVDWN